MSVIEKVSSISNELANILDFAAKNETIKTDFENYLKTIGAYNAPESKVHSLLVSYVFERVLNKEGDTVFSLYAKENKKLDSHQKTLLKALQSSMNTVFEVKNVLKNAFELYNLVNEKDYTVIPLVKMSHLRGIYKGTYLLARIFCFENEYFLLEITETMSSLKKDEMLKLAVAKIIEEPERVYADNKAKMKDIEKELKQFSTKFNECFETDEVLTINDAADNVIAAFNDFCLDEITDAQKIRELVIAPQNFGYSPVSEFNSSYNNYLEKSLGGFSSHSTKYDVGIIFEEGLGLYIVPFWGTLCKIFEAENFKEIQGWDVCVKQFLENDKMSSALVERLNKKYPEFVNRVNEIYESQMSFEEILSRFKQHFLDKKIFSPTSVLYSSKAFSDLMGFIPDPNKKAPAQPAVKPGRNDLCPCGSGKKYKKCCGMV